MGYNGFMDIKENEISLKPLKDKDVNIFSK